MIEPPVLDETEITPLFPDDLPEPSHWEARYPMRDLPPGAEVTRLSPSPTGFAHIGAVYIATVDRALAHQTGGTYILRIEDTDRDREVEGAAAQFDRAFAYFGVLPNEGDPSGPYGPYTQSQRSTIYMTYVRALLLANLAYPCFCTKEELALAAAEQRAARVPTGYYGRWARCRHAPDDLVRELLALGQPYVVRFRSPGELAGRVRYTDLIRGEIEADDNRNDIVILRSSSNALRLPTYHLAHAVDDHLMRVTLVVRGEEWIPSVPVHLQLFDALGFDRIPYAHIAPLMKHDGKGKRKLSKRHDPEANLEYYIAAGYPAAAVAYYLRGLANSRLAELPISEALAEPLYLAEFGVAGPLVDLPKLDDVAADVVGTMEDAEVFAHVCEWARSYDTALLDVLDAERDLALRALGVDRRGVENPRKDLAKWSDFRQVYGYFFAASFELVTDPSDPRFDGTSPTAVEDLCRALLENYLPLDGDAWFDQLRTVAASVGFAPTVGEYKKNPDDYEGSIREASQVIRVAITGAERTPPLQLIATVLGEEEVRRRVGAVLGR
jgi:glutamyl-tRNA synthetase